MIRLRDASRILCSALAATLFATLFISLGRVDVPTGLLATLAALVLLSAVRPDAALLVVAALVPVSSWLGRHVQPGVNWPESLVLGFLIGYCARQVIVRREPRDDLNLPVTLAAIVIVASLVVQILADTWRFGGADEWQRLQEIVRNYLVSGRGPNPIDAAMRLLEGMLLVKAVSAATIGHQRFAPRLTRSIVLGAAAAGTITLARIWTAARSLDSPVRAFGNYLLTVRFNAHYGDLNAAGSYYILVLSVAVGLMLLPRQKGWLAAALVIGLALQATGSRSAIVAGILAAIVPAVYIARRKLPPIRRPVILAGAIVGISLLATGVAYYFPVRAGQQGTALQALQIRRELIGASSRMIASRPWFGIGVGQYYARSSDFSSPELVRNFPPAGAENAHNNFLQLLAEFGVVGFLAFCWVVWTASGGARRLIESDGRDPLRWGVVTGLVAFLISCLGGHPLLTDEPAFTFWMLVGAVSGWGGSKPIPDERRRSYQPWIAAAAASLLIAVSVPARARQDVAESYLEHVGIGLSAWQHGPDGMRYRLAGAVGTVYVPTYARIVTLPLRAAGPADLPRVELHLDGRLANVASVPHDRWWNLQMLLPETTRGPRFRRLEIRVVGAEDTTMPLLMIGKVEPR